MTTPESIEIKVESYNSTNGSTDTPELQMASPSHKRARDQSPSPTGERKRTPSACEPCYRLKLKCDPSRPCRTCTRRGVQCIPKVKKPRACRECKSRKIKCDLQHPCQNCAKNNRQCNSTDGESRNGASPIFFTPTDVTETPLELPAWIQNVGTDDDPFGLASFEFDQFPSMTPFWPDPLFQSPPSSHFQDNHPLLIFDDFDRARILHDLEKVPFDAKGELPSCAQLSTILHQYFEYINPFTPFIHMPSFGVKTCPTLFLLLLLAVGDVYSEHRTLEQWARRSFKFLLDQQIERYEVSDEELPITTIQALNMWVYHLAYVRSDDPKAMLQATHNRITLSYACQSLQTQAENSVMTEGDDESAWISWIQSETRRRTLMSVYMADTMISMFMNVAPLLRVSQLKVPLPESDDLWYAESHQKWQRLRRTQKKVVSLHFNEVLADLMSAGALIKDCNGVVGLHVIAVGIEEMIAMARRLREVDGQGHICSKALMAKSREALEGWKAAWQLGSQRETTKAQYIAILSAWCCAEISLAAPEVILTTVFKVSRAKDPSPLVKTFLKDMDQFLQHLDADILNNLMSAAAAAVCHVESLSDFGTVTECITTVEASVFPNVITSIFDSGLTLWFTVKVLEKIGRYVPRAENEILPRLLKALNSIPWVKELSLEGNASIAALLGDLLIKMRIWGICLNLF